MASKQMLSLPVLNGFMVKASASGHILPGQHSGLIVTSPKLQTWAEFYKKPGSEFI